MNREDIYQSWVPPDGEWSLWARPVLFAQMPDAESERTPDEPWRTFDVSWAPSSSEKTVVVVDLPGEESVWMGLALAGRGYRPVPLYNACTGPHEVIVQLRIIEALRAGAQYLASQPLPGAPPAFLLDDQRMTPVSPVRPGDFDNRWTVYPQDFPSADFLTARGFVQVLLIQRRRLQPRADLADLLRKWQAAGMTILAKEFVPPGPPTPIVIGRIPWYRSAWHRLLEMLGLRRSPRGGFGHIVPKPSHG
jgi:hypothetical protein